VLSVSDFVVVIGCAVMYALPDIWPYFRAQAYPLVMPRLLPCVQIAMMTSVYATIVLSFERYVRIGHTVRFRRYSYITEGNFK